MKTTLRLWWVAALALLAAGRAAAAVVELRGDVQGGEMQGGDVQGDVQGHVNGEEVQEEAVQGVEQRDDGRCERVCPSTAPTHAPGDDQCPPSCPTPVCHATQCPSLPEIPPCPAPSCPPCPVPVVQVTCPEIPAPTCPSCPPPTECPHGPTYLALLQTTLQPDPYTPPSTPAITAASSPPTRITPSWATTPSGPPSELANNATPSGPATSAPPSPSTGITPSSTSATRAPPSPSTGITPSSTSATRAPPTPSTGITPSSTSATRAPPTTRTPTTPPSTPVAAPGQSPPSGYHEYPGVGLFKYHATKASWGAALAQCSREGAHLAVPDSADEVNIFKTMMEKHNVWNVQIGFVETNGRYETVLGTPMNSFHTSLWQPTYPQRGSSDRGIVLYRDGTAWTYNAHNKDHFICEFFASR